MSTDPLLEDVIEWDVENWSAALEFWRRHSALGATPSEAMELGSRHGGLALWLALQGANVLCTDVEGPTDLARQKHARHGVAERISYAAVDAVDIPYESRFDVIAFKSVLGGVGWTGRKDRQRAAIEQIHKALRPGGELWFAENLVGSPLHRVLRSRFVPWAKDWRYVQIDEMKQFLAGFASLSYCTVGVLGAFGRSAGQRAWLGKVDRIAFDRVVPPAWRYIMIGVASKSGDR